MTKINYVLAQWWGTCGLPDVGHSRQTKAALPVIRDYIHVSLLTSGGPQVSCPCFGRLTCGVDVEEILVYLKGGIKMAFLWMVDFVPSLPSLSHKDAILDLDKHKSEQWLNQSSAATGLTFPLKFMSLFSHGNLIWKQVPRAIAMETTKRPISALSW